jgi:hypothetical protein
MNKDEKILHLTLKKKWFDMIALGEKKEEYREVKPYWLVRLCNVLEWRMQSYMQPDFSHEEVDYTFEKYTHIVFTNGYAKNAPKIKVKCLGIEIGTAKPEWSDNWQGDVFIIKLGKIITNNTNNEE